MSATGVQEEMIDVLTVAGDFVGSFPRSQVHREGLWHKVIHLWIADKNGNLVIQKRAACKESFPGKWDISVAGHISAGDDAKATCIKEAEEELGLQVTLEELRMVATSKNEFLLRNGTYKDNEFVEVYMIVRDNLDLSTVVLQESEVEEVRWIPWRELKKEASVPDSNYVPWDEPKYSGFWAYMEKTFG